MATISNTFVFCHSHSLEKFVTRVQFLIFFTDLKFKHAQCIGLKNKGKKFTCGEKSTFKKTYCFSLNQNSLLYSKSGSACK